MDALDIALPPEIGSCKRRFRGEARETIVLVATGPGHPPTEERAVLEVLRHLHTAAPIEWLFETLDGSIKGGGISIDEREIDVRAYRSLPDKKIITDIAVYMVTEGINSAAWAFAVTCEPPAHLQPFDDWYGWARQRDALRRMDREAGRMESICSVLESLVPQGAPQRETLETMAGLMRLTWTGADWVAGKAQLPIDPGGLLSRLPAAPDALASTAEFLTRFQSHASEFYESGLARTEALVSKALKALRRAGASRGAMILGAAWIDSAAELLTARNVGFVELWPHDVRVLPMLDHASVIIDEQGESRRKLAELFTGQTIRSQVEALFARPDTRRRDWGRDWSAAGQGLLFAQQFDKADECATRALEIEPTGAEAWTTRGIVASERSQQQAASFFERAVALRPGDSRYWGLKGEALDKLGRTREARKALVRAIHLDPRGGAAWCRFGVHLYHRGRRSEACYCFERGKTYGDDAAADNWRITCHSPVAPGDCPREVRAWRLSLAQRLRKWPPKLGFGR